MDEKVIWESEAGTFLKITVNPNSKKKKFVERLSEVEIVFNLKSPAREGKANVELLKRLSKLLQLSTNDIRIIAGHKSKIKTLLIEGLSTDDVKAMLSNA